MNPLTPARPRLGQRPAHWRRARCFPILLRRPEQPERNGFGVLSRQRSLPSVTTLPQHSELTPPRPRLAAVLARPVAPSLLADRPLRQAQDRPCKHGR
jgi:hypothetical protein